MDINWSDLGLLGEEPALSLAALEPPDQHANEPLEVIDWDALQIIYSHEDEGRDEIVDDNRMYELMGLTAEDEAADKASEADTRDENGPVDDEAVDNFSDVGDDYLGAAIPVDDDVPGETVVVHDPNKPCMDIGTVYPRMVDFRNAIRQFAINEEFVLKTIKSDRTRFTGGCKVQDCRWHIVGRRQPDGKSVMVTVLFAEHNCASSARRKTTTPTSAWVASKAIHYLKKNSNMGPKELRNRFVVRAPLGKRGKGRQKKLRMKSSLEGGNSKGKKAAAERGKEADKEADKEAMEAAKQTEKGKKQMIRGKRKCKRYGELGHGETSYKCPLNGTKKRKRKPRKNTTKYGENAKVPTSRKRAKKGETVQEREKGAAAVIVCEDGAAAAVQEREGPADVQEREQVVAVPLLMQSPTKPTMESIIQNSPIRVTRSRLAMLLGGDTASQNNVQTSPTCTTKPLPRKLTPKKLKMK